MPQLITVGGKLIRINSLENRLEISFTNGATWMFRSRMGKMFGHFKDLLWFHNKLFALTDTGIWRSINEGATWARCGSGKIVENLVALQDGGQYLYGLSSDGHLWFSSNEGTYWAHKG